MGCRSALWEAVHEGVNDGDGSKLALIWLGKKGARREITYSDLASETARFANVLIAHGLKQGDGVYSLTGRIPDLYIAALGTLKAGLVFTPLFSAFGPDPIRTRMEIGNAKALITTAQLYKRKIATWRHQLPSLKLILIVGEV